MKKTCLSATLISVLLIAGTSCIDNSRDLYTTLDKHLYFDFNLNQKVTLDVDYNFKKDYVVLFDIYDQNPLKEKEDGTVEKKEINPIYRAATNSAGQFTGDMETISDLSEVWLYSDFPGTISPVRLAIDESRQCTFNQDSYIATLQSKVKTTRGTTSSGHTYPDNWMVLGNWSDLGRPNYMEPELATPPATVFYDIKGTYRVAGDYKIKDQHPEFFTGNMVSDVSIIKPTKISLIFINSNAGFNNTVGYFTYPTGQQPDKSSIQRIVAFPNASPISKMKNDQQAGTLVCGDEVALKYWDGQKLHDEFPAGVTIGWCLAADSYDNTTNNIGKGMGEIRYSTKALNNDNAQRTVALRSSDSDQIVSIGFEDYIDFTYCDATFYLHVEQSDAVDNGTLPELPPTEPPTNIENFTIYSGVLTYEDLWPKKGDYDMNDIMIDYTSKVYKTIIGNKVNKIVDEFVPRHNGGMLQTGFGYELHNLLPNQIRNVKIEEEDGIVSRYMEGKSMEPGQDHPTILLFDDIRSVLQKKFTVTIDINDVDNAKLLIAPPYNPFIFVESNLGRGKEVHLAKYPPTSKADFSLFGTKDDGSRPEEELYYVVTQWNPQLPFAIHMPKVTDFPTPDEGELIYETYPTFINWIRSGGTTNKDWYKKRK